MTDWQQTELRLQVVDVASGGSITYTTPEGILAALAEAGVLFEEETGPYYSTEGVMESPLIVRYVSSWKEAQ